LRKTQIVVDEVARLEELLSDLLDMARPRQLNLQSQDVNAIVEHALLLANADIQGLNVTVQKHLDEGLPPILVDRSRLLQALLNTVRNGAQAMPEGGVLEITTRVPQLSTGLASHLEIEIRDHGIGISERGLKQIFDPFFSTKISGSGLGLAVTRRIIQDHGGDIDVYSQEGSGTTFILCLPLRLASCPISYETPALPATES
jgi:signal transduction histidine kinase